MFAGDITVHRADGKGRADREIGQMEILGNPLYQQPGAAPVIQPLTKKAVENRAAGVKRLQPS